MSDNYMKLSHVRHLKSGNIASSARVAAFAMLLLC
jgi:hypothetical protein